MVETGERKFSMYSTYAGATFSEGKEVRKLYFYEYDDRAGRSRYGTTMP